MAMLEAHCRRCGEVFVPADEDDLIHLIKEDGSDCGGTGVVAGEWLTPTEAAVRAVVAQAKAEIIRDAQAGHLPVDAITTFADLHDYTDANTYGGLCDEHVAEVFRVDDIDTLNLVQDTVDVWIKEGGLRRALEE